MFIVDRGVLLGKPKRMVMNLLAGMRIVISLAHQFLKLKPEQLETKIICKMG